MLSHQRFGRKKSSESHVSGLQQKLEELGGVLRCEETHRRRNGHPPPGGRPPRKPFRPHPQCAVLVPQDCPCPLRVPLSHLVTLHSACYCCRCLGTPVRNVEQLLGSRQADTVSDRSPSPASPSANSPPAPGGARRTQTRPHRRRL